MDNDWASSTIYQMGNFLVKIQRALLWESKNVIQAQLGFLRDGAKLADEELVCCKLSLVEHAWEEEIGEATA